MALSSYVEEQWNTCISKF